MAINTTDWEQYSDEDIQSNISRYDSRIAGVESKIDRLIQSGGNPSEIRNLEQFALALSREQETYLKQRYIREHGEPENPWAHLDIDVKGASPHPESVTAREQRKPQAAQESPREEPSIENLEAQREFYSHHHPEHLKTDVVDPETGEITAGAAQAKRPNDVVETQSQTSPKPRSKTPSSTPFEDLTDEEIDQYIDREDSSWRSSSYYDSGSKEENRRRWWEINVDPQSAGTADSPKKLSDIDPSLKRELLKGYESRFSPESYEARYGEHPMADRERRLQQAIEEEEKHTVQRENLLKEISGGDATPEQNQELFNLTARRADAKSTQKSLRLEIKQNRPISAKQKAAAPVQEASAPSKAPARRPPEPKPSIPAQGPAETTSTDPQWVQDLVKRAETTVAKGAGPKKTPAKDLPRPSTSGPDLTQDPVEATSTDPKWLQDLVKRTEVSAAQPDVAKPSIAKPKPPQESVGRVTTPQHRPLLPNPTNMTKREIQQSIKEFAGDQPAAEWARENLNVELWKDPVSKLKSRVSEHRAENVNLSSGGIDLREDLGVTIPRGSERPILGPQSSVLHPGQAEQYEQETPEIVADKKRLGTVKAIRNKILDVELGLGADQQTTIEQSLTGVQGRLESAWRGKEAQESFRTDRPAIRPSELPRSEAFPEEFRGMPADPQERINNALKGRDVSSMTMSEIGRVSMHLGDDDIADQARDALRASVGTSRRELYLKTVKSFGINTEQVDALLKAQGVFWDNTDVSDKVRYGLVHSFVAQRTGMTSQAMHAGGWSSTAANQYILSKSTPIEGIKKGMSSQQILGLVKPGHIMVGETSEVPAEALSAIPGIQLETTKDAEGRDVQQLVQMAKPGKAVKATKLGRQSGETFISGKETRLSNVISVDPSGDPMGGQDFIQRTEALVAFGRVNPEGSGVRDPSMGELFRIHRRSIPITGDDPELLTKEGQGFKRGEKILPFAGASEQDIGPHYKRSTILSQGIVDKVDAETGEEGRYLEMQIMGEMDPSGMSAMKHGGLKQTSQTMPGTKERWGVELVASDIRDIGMLGASFTSVASQEELEDWFGAKPELGLEAVPIERAEMPLELPEVDPRKGRPWTEKEIQQMTEAQQRSAPIIYTAEMQQRFADEFARRTGMNQANTPELFREDDPATQAKLEENLIERVEGKDAPEGNFWGKETAVGTRLPIGTRFTKGYRWKNQRLSPELMEMIGREHPGMASTLEGLGASAGFDAQQIAMAQMSNRGVKTSLESVSIRDVYSQMGDIGIDVKARLAEQGINPGDSSWDREYSRQMAMSIGERFSGRGIYLPGMGEKGAVLPNPASMLRYLGAQDQGRPLPEQAEGLVNVLGQALEHHEQSVQGKDVSKRSEELRQSVRNLYQGNEEEGIEGIEKLTKGAKFQKAVFGTHASGARFGGQIVPVKEAPANRFMAGPDALRSFLLTKGLSESESNQLASDIFTGKAEAPRVAALRDPMLSEMQLKGILEYMPVTEWVSQGYGSAEDYLTRFESTVGFGKAVGQMGGGDYDDDPHSIIAATLYGLGKKGKVIAQHLAEKSSIKDILDAAWSHPAQEAQGEVKKVRDFTDPSAVKTEIDRMMYRASPAQVAAQHMDAAKTKASTGSIFNMFKRSMETKIRGRSKDEQIARSELGSLSLTSIDIKKQSEGLKNLIALGGSATMSHTSYFDPKAKGGKGGWTKFSGNRGSSNLATEDLLNTVVSNILDTSELGPTAKAAAIVAPEAVGEDLFGVLKGMIPSSEELGNMSQAERNETQRGIMDMLKPFYKDENGIVDEQAIARDFPVASHVFQQALRRDYEAAETKGKTERIEGYDPGRREIAEQGFRVNEMIDAQSRKPQGLVRNVFNRLKDLIPGRQRSAERVARHRMGVNIDPETGDLAMGEPQIAASEDVNDSNWGFLDAWSKGISQGEAPEEPVGQNANLLDIDPEASSRAMYTSLRDPEIPRIAAVSIDRELKSGGNLASAYSKFMSELPEDLDRDEAEMYFAKAARVTSQAFGDVPDPIANDLTDEEFLGLLKQESSDKAYGMPAEERRDANRVTAERASVSNRKGLLSYLEKGSTGPSRDEDPALPSMPVQGQPESHLLTKEQLLASGVKPKTYSDPQDSGIDPGFDPRQYGVEKYGIVSDEEFVENLRRLYPDYTKDKSDEELLERSIGFSRDNEAYARVPDVGMSGLSPEDRAIASLGHEVGHIVHDSDPGIIAAAEKYLDEALEKGVVSEENLKKVYGDDWRERAPRELAADAFSQRVTGISVSPYKAPPDPLEVAINKVVSKTSQKKQDKPSRLFSIDPSTLATVHSKVGGRTHVVKAAADIISGELESGGDLVSAYDKFMAEIPEGDERRDAAEMEFARVAHYVSPGLEGGGENVPDFLASGLTPEEFLSSMKKESSKRKKEAQEKQRPAQQQKAAPNFPDDPLTDEMIPPEAMDEEMFETPMMGGAPPAPPQGPPPAAPGMEDPLEDRPTGNELTPTGERVQEQQQGSGISQDKFFEFMSKKFFAPKTKLYASDAPDALAEMRRFSRGMQQWTDTIQPNIQAGENMSKEQIRFTKELSGMAETIQSWENDLKGMDIPEAKEALEMLGKLKESGAFGDIKEGMGYQRTQELEKMFRSAAGIPEEAPTAIERFWQKTGLYQPGRGTGGGVLGGAGQLMQGLSGWQLMQMQRMWQMTGGDVFSKYIPKAAEADIGAYKSSTAIGGAPSGPQEYYGTAGSLLNYYSSQRQAQINAGRTGHDIWGSGILPGGLSGLKATIGPALGGGLIASKLGQMAGQVGGMSSGVAMSSIGVPAALLTAAGMGIYAFGKKASSLAEGSSESNLELIRELRARQKSKERRGGFGDLLENIKIGGQATMYGVGSWLQGGNPADMWADLRSAGRLEQTQIGAMDGGQRAAVMSHIAQSMRDTSPGWGHLDETQINEIITQVSQYQDLSGMTAQDLIEGGGTELMKLTKSQGLNLNALAQMGQRLGYGPTEGVDILAQGLGRKSSIERTEAEYQLQRTGAPVYQAYGIESGLPEYYAREEETEENYREAVRFDITASDLVKELFGDNAPDPEEMREKYFDVLKNKPENIETMDMRRFESMVSQFNQMGMMGFDVEQPEDGILTTDFIQRQWQQFPKMQAQSKVAQQIQGMGFGLDQGVSAAEASGDLYGLGGVQALQGFMGGDSRTMNAMGMFNTGNYMMDTNIEGFDIDTAKMRTAIVAGLKEFIPPEYFDETMEAMKGIRPLVQESGQAMGTTMMWEGAADEARAAHTLPHTVVGERYNRYLGVLEESGQRGIATQMTELQQRQEDYQWTQSYNKTRLSEVSQFGGTFRNQFSGDVLNTRGSFEISKELKGLSRQWENFSNEFSEAQRMLSRSHFMENIGVQESRMPQQFEWQRADLAFQGQQQSINYGWNMEDIQEKLRFASGRDRMRLLKEQQRATIRYGMGQGQLDEQGQRLDVRQGWAEEDIERQKRQFEERFALQDEYQFRFRSYMEERRSLEDEMQQIQEFNARYNIDSAYEQLARQKELTAEIRAAQEAQKAMNELLSDAQSYQQNVISTIMFMGTAFGTNGLVSTSWNNFVARMAGSIDDLTSRTTYLSVLGGNR